VSRQFDTTAGADSITFSVGNSPPDQGPITVAVLAKASSVAGFTGWMIAGRKSGTAVWGLLTSNNAGPKLFAENDFGNGISGLSTSWRWYVMTKASGNVAPRISVWDLSGAWSHTDNSAGVGDGTGAIDTLLVGSQNGTNNGWRGSIAVIATWDTQLNDAGVEAACTLAALDTLNASPKWMIRLNQASTATSITDDTGGGGNQSALSGTSVDADDPSGYNYSLAQTIAPNSLSVAAALGAPTLAQSLTVTPTSLSVATSLGAPTLAQSFTITPTSLSVPTALGAPTAAMAQPSFECAADSLDVAVTLGAPALSFTVAEGSWTQLSSIVREARADHERNQYRLANPIDCPEHGWPLERTSRGLHCQFGGHVVR
jgi:hypothetical protein